MLQGSNQSPYTYADDPSPNSRIHDLTIPRSVHVCQYSISYAAARIVPRSCGRLRASVRCMSVLRPQSRKVLWIVDSSSRHWPYMRTGIWNLLWCLTNDSMVLQWLHGSTAWFKPEEHSSSPSWRSSPLFKIPLLKFWERQVDKANAFHRYELYATPSEACSNAERFGERIKAIELSDVTGKFNTLLWDCVVCENKKTGNQEMQSAIKNWGNPLQLDKLWIRH